MIDAFDAIFNMTYGLARALARALARSRWVLGGLGRGFSQVLGRFPVRSRFIGASRCVLGGFAVGSRGRAVGHDIIPN